MTKDYAKRVYVNERKKPPNQKGIALLVAVLLVIGIGLYANLARIKTWLRPAALPVTVKKEETREPEVQFSFYNALPKMRMEVRQPEESQVQEKTTPEEKSTKVEAGYFLQFGLFKEASRASQVRLSLLLAGIETEIEKEQSNEGTSYRVQQGPFTTLSQAKGYQRKWQKKGIDCVIKNE